MGISITMQYNPAKIDENRWPEAFQETMKISRAGKLAELCVGKYEGNTYYPLRLSEPISRAWFRNDTVRWHANGDLLTGSNMEDFSLPAVWERNQESPSGDILLAFCQVGDSKLPQPKFPFLWGGKTQGKRGHIWLLAMACVLCDHFPEGFFVYGDITAGQCIRASKIAEEVLGREVRIPVQFDAERLLSRVQAITDGEQKTLNSFLTLYQGLEGPEFNAFLTKHFSREDLYRHYRAKAKDGSRLNDLMRDWLGITKDLRALAEMLVTDPEGPRISPEQFIKEVVDAKLHIEDKLVYDVTRTEKANDAPDTVGMLFTRAFAVMAGLRNKSIDFYLPLTELIVLCQDVFGDRCDVKAVFTEKLAPPEEGCPKQKVQEIYDQVEAEAEAQESRPHYDVERPEHLFYWESPEETIEPKLWDEVLKSLKKIWDFSAEYRKAFLAMDRTDRIQFLTSHGRELTLAAKEEQWQEMFARIMDDVFIERYVALWTVGLSGDAKILGNALMLNAPLFEYCWDAALKE